MGYFTPSFLVSLSVVRDFGETSVSVVEGPDNTGSALELQGWKDRLSLLGAHTDTVVLPVCRADGKCADKSSFL